jgi:hypothetical protein
MELGGFDEALYPNEENALMDNLQKRGAKLLYDPEFVAYRRPRPNLQTFIKLLMTYGRGRAEQFRLHPTPGSMLNFVPPMFCVYVLLVPLCGMLGWLPGIFPMGVYALAVVSQTIASMKRHGIARSVLAMPLLFFTWIFYGIGFWRGLFTRLKPARGEPGVKVALERIAI